MTRLFVQIYATLLLVIVLFAAAWSWVWSAAMGPHEARMLEGVAHVAGDLVPRAGAPRDEIAAVLERIGDALLADAVLLDEAGAPIARSGAAIEPAEIAAARAGELRTDASYLFHLPLADGRVLVARHAYEHGHWREIGGGAALLAIAVALGALPLVRQLTRRLERLRARVEALGA
jgi:hypothetical protein